MNNDDVFEDAWIERWFDKWPETREYLESLEREDETDTEDQS